MNAWRAVPFHPRLLAGLALLLAALAVYRYWEAGRPDPSAAEAALQPHPELLVEPQWLGAHLNDANLRVVDVRDRSDYVAGHIPGAVWFSTSHLFSERDGVRGMLPSVEEVEAALREAGIGAETIVVAYDNQGGLSAARLFWALDYLGQGKGRLLNGGWAEWGNAGLPVSTETVTPPPSDFRARIDRDRLADLDWMKAHIGDGERAFVDARSPAEYAGSSGHAQRAGHIPGAVSLEWRNDLVPGSQRFRPAAELLAAFRKAGVTPDKEVAPYCQSFVRAAHTYFTLRWLGYPRVRGYDGSWSEWGNRPDTPIETGAPTPASGGLTRKQQVAASAELRGGFRLAEVKALMGAPDAAEEQNPCWGRQTVWRYDLPHGALRLTFVDGVLKTIDR